MTQQDEKISELTKEIINLRSYKEKSFMKYAQFEAQIKQLKRDAETSKDKIQELIAARQKADFISGTKTSVNVQLQEEIRKMEGTIDGLEAVIKQNREKEVTAEDRYTSFEKIIKSKEKTIEEHLESMKDQDKQIQQLHQTESALSFKVFEFENA